MISDGEMIVLDFRFTTRDLIKDGEVIFNTTSVIISLYVFHEHIRRNENEINAQRLYRKISK